MHATPFQSETERARLITIRKRAMFAPVKNRPVEPTPATEPVAPRVDYKPPIRRWSDTRRQQWLTMCLMIINASQQPVGARGGRFVKTSSLKLILSEVAAKYELPMNAIMSVRKPPNLVHARQEIYWRAYLETALSYPEIGRRIGGRDHTTVLHGKREYERKQRVQAGLEPMKKNDRADLIRMVIAEGAK